MATKTKTSGRSVSSTLNSSSSGKNSSNSLSRRKSINSKSILGMAPLSYLPKNDLELGFDFILSTLSAKSEGGRKSAFQKRLDKDDMATFYRDIVGSFAHEGCPLFMPDGAKIHIPAAAAAASSAPHGGVSGGHTHPSTVINKNISGIWEGSGKAREEMTLEALTNLLIRKHPHAYPVDDLFNTLCSEDGFIPREFWKKYVKFLGDAYFNGMIFKNDVDDVIWMFDSDGDGKIGRKDFLEMRGFNKPMLEHILDKEMRSNLGGVFQE